MTKEEMLEYINKILNRELKPWQNKYLVVTHIKFFEELKKFLEKNGIK